MNAIRSALIDREFDIRVLVSDNSTESDQKEILQNFCNQISDDRLKYIQPPQTMPMGAHWEWALKQALAEAEISHVLYLTDRMVMKRGELKNVLMASKQFPDNIISYGSDGVYDFEMPIRLSQPSWTGNLYQIPTTELLRLSSNCIFHMSLPCMLNCLVPRGIFSEIETHYGNVFGSIAPDFTFAFRCLERFDTVIHFDRTVQIHYALKRSNGASQGRGTANKDHSDFLANLPKEGLNFAAPVPQFKTVGNAVVHEYCLIQKQTKSKKFPPVNLNSYYKMVESEIEILEDTKLHKEMHELLKRQPYDPKLLRKEKLQRLKSSLFSARFWNVKFWWIITSPRFHGTWDFLWKSFKIQPRGVREMVTEMDSTEAALEYASAHPRRRNPGSSYIETLIKVNRLPIKNVESRQ
jgi:hypothetical protein